MTDKRRLFFAVWPDAAAVKDLNETARDAQHSCGGRLMRSETLHLTLAFLGDVAVERVGDAVEVAAGVAMPRFPLVLDQLKYWKHNRILWAGGESQALAALASSLQAGLRAAGFVLEARPFVAHMTLLRDARCPMPASLRAPIAWPVTEFTLVESRPSTSGPHYGIVERWPLLESTIA